MARLLTGLFNFLLQLLSSRDFGERFCQATSLRAREL